MESPAVARAGYEGMMKGKGVVIPGARNRLMTTSIRLLPRATVAKFVRMAQERVSA